MHTRQKSFRHFSRKKRPLRENADTTKKCFTDFFRFFPGDFFMYHKFLHLTTIFFSREDRYFSYTMFLLEQNRIFSHHSRIFSHHSRVFSHHSRVFSHHNRVLSKHNRILSKHNRILLKHNRVLLKHNRVLLKHKRAKIEENGRILHNLAFV